MKTKEELNVLKIEIESLNAKLRELSTEELNDVIGGDELFGGLTPYYERLMFLIEHGEEAFARGYYRQCLIMLKPKKDAEVRAAFLEKFGYEIDGPKPE